MIGQYFRGCQEPLDYEEKMTLFSDDSQALLNCFRRVKSVLYIRKRGMESWKLKRLTYPLIELESINLDR